MSGKMAAGWSKWKEVDRMTKLALDRNKWRALGKGLYLRTGLGMMSELLRRWKSVNRVLRRALGGKLGAGWFKWLAMDKMAQLLEDRKIWRRLGLQAYKKTGLGLFAEVLRRWKLLRRVLLRAVSGKLGVGWTKWKLVFALEKTRQLWRRFGMSLYKQSTYGLFSEMVRVWKLLRRTLKRAANDKLAGGWSKWREVIRFRHGKFRKRTCDCVHKLTKGLQCRCSRDKHLALRMRALRVNIDQSLDGQAARGLGKQGRQRSTAMPYPKHMPTSISWW
eukprot:FR737857.1.p1 GENE.FR737857.1~~FR737857.1.p1  ORF type:complete len:276 (+),score=10.06 FR737857.1:2-829(+)